MKKNKVLIIAEAGVNHNGKMSLAKKLIEIAKKSGADYIKFQMFKTSDHVTKKATQAKYQIRNLKKKTNQFDMIKKLEFNEKQFSEIQSYSKKKKIKFLASCFDLKSVNNYSKFKPNFYKIPSGEITNLPLLEIIGKKNKKILLSTGMAKMNEIQSAINILIKNGSSLKNITVLQCTTDYPCKISDVNLLVIPEIIKKFKCNVGFSDHTTSLDIANSAIAYGASVIEKHVTINNLLKGPDHKASLNPKDFKSFVNKIRVLEKAMGSNQKQPTENEKKNIYLVRKSIVAIKKIKKGEILTRMNIGAKRPGNGISPMKIYSFYGKKSKKNYEQDEKL